MTVIDLSLLLLFYQGLYVYKLVAEQLKRARANRWFPPRGPWPTASVPCTTG